MDERLIKLMQQFNFSQISALAYSLLLVDGPLSVKQLRDKVATSHKHIEHTLEQLMALHLISTDHQRDQSYYYATDPSLAWRALATELVWEIEDTLVSHTELPETDNQSVEELRTLCNDISSLTQSLYKPYVAVLQHKERDANSLEELAQLTCEAIQQAQKQVIAVDKSPKLPQVSSFWTVLTRRIEKGVRYCRIVDLDELIDHGLSIVARDMEIYNIDLRVLEQDQLTHRFYVIDKKLLAIFNTSSALSGHVDATVGRITSQYQIIARYRKRFNQYYANSIPASFAVNYMRNLARKMLEDVAKKFSPTELLWLESLIELGKFSRFHRKKKWSEKQISFIEQKAMAAGVVRRNAEGYIVPVYPINDAKLRAAYNTLH